MDVAFNADWWHKEFIRKYKKNLDNKNACTNKLGMDICIRVNDYLAAYIDFMKVGNVVFTFLEKFNGKEDRISSLWMNILSSLKKQFNLICYLKRICKKTCINKQDYIMFVDTIGKAVKRFDYLYDRILPEYMNITPLYSYKKILVDKGINFVDDIRQNIDFDADSEDLRQEKVNEYCDRIIAICDKNDTTWKKNLEDYRARSEERLAYIKEEKKKEREEAWKNKSEEAQRNLNTYADAIRRSYQKSYVSGDRRGAGILVPRVVEFTERGEKCKIVLLLGSQARARNCLKFYSKEKDGNTCSGFSTCSILLEHEEVSQDILDKVNDYKMVMCEIVLN